MSVTNKNISLGPVTTTVSAAEGFRHPKNLSLNPSTTVTVAKLKAYLKSPSSISASTTVSASKAYTWSKKPSTITVSTTVTRIKSIGKPISLLLASPTIKNKYTWPKRIVLTPLTTTLTAAIVRHFKKSATVSTVSTTISAPVKQIGLPRSLHPSSTVTVNHGRLLYKVVTLTVSTTVTIAKAIWHLASIIITSLRPTITLDDDGDQP